MDTLPSESVLELHHALSPQQLEEVRTLFREYEQSIGVSLCFQNFEEELRLLPGDYVEPQGALLLVTVDGVPAGCCALRKMEKGHYTNAAEMKRLFVRSPFRGRGIARKLVMEILRRAADKGYEAILLDTLKMMKEAQGLYGALGFVEIEPYYINPMEGTKFMMLDLRKASFLH